MTTIGVVRGDGIGPEIIDSAVRVCDAAAAAVGAAPLRWVEVAAGQVAIDDGGIALPAAAVRALEGCDGALLGPVDHAVYPRYADGRRQNPSGELRRHFDLYANVRPARTVDGVRSMAATADLVIVRENTEGFYSDRNMYRGTGEFSISPEVALSVGVFTRDRVRRVIRFAYALAAQRRGVLTVVHKANVLPQTTGMYPEVAAELAGEFPSVTVDDEHVDAMAALLVRAPQRFDVVVTENLFGDILSDLAAELAGSLGMAGSLNVGDHYAIAQAAHGSAPDIAGLGVANPISEITSAAMLLTWLGERRGEPALGAAAALVQRATAAVLPAVATRDLGGRAGTAEFTAAVIESLDRRAAG
ncbi:isocitrate/isopropylmalate dehydrogenase family protein [Mycolicibacterium sp.]|uniref:isocitrate/isopropylmalate dehydrogenase family protein n=1 Tax=Mycolicibacterium sp. TaxID=2320850 RepID=UPI003D0D9DCB